MAPEWRRIPVALFPLAWWNEAGGLVGGLQVRSQRLGLMHDLLVRVGLPAAPVLEQGERSPGIDPGSVYARIADPLVGDLPRFGTTADFFIGEGRGFVGWSHARRRASRTPYGPSPLARGGVAESEPTLRVFGGLHWVYDDRYLVEGRWTPGQKMGFEGGLAASVARSGDAVRVNGSVSAGFDSDDRRWVRATAAFKGSVSPSESFELRTRLFGGIAIGPDPDPGSQWDGRFVPRERLFFLAGGGPFEAYSNPWVRSHGAPLAEGGWVAGGGELRGFHPGVALAELAAATATALGPRIALPLGNRTWSARPVAFAGVTVGGPLQLEGHPTVLELPEPAERADSNLYWSAGAGIEVGVSGSPFRIELAVPFATSRPELAAMGRDEKMALRWSVGVSGTPRE